MKEETYNEAVRLQRAIADKKDYLELLRGLLETAPNRKSFNISGSGSDRIVIDQDIYIRTLASQLNRVETELSDLQLQFSNL